MVDDDDDDDELAHTTVGNRVAIAAAVGSRVGNQRPWLVVVSGSDSIGKMYRLKHGITIGRSPQCDVRLDEDGVSRRHARIEQTQEGAVEVVDLGSSNGTFVNGASVSRAALRDGDKIQIGPTTILKFSYQDDLDEALQRNLYESATRDPLTQAANRRSFDDALARELAFAGRHGRALSVVVFDVDHFKRVNDSHGHPAGDHVLRRLAQIVSANIRGEDLFARVGGEEFALLLRDIDGEGARQCAERLRSAVESAAFEQDGALIPVTISAGVATRVVGSTPEAIVKEADGRLYEAKQAGRNRVCWGARSGG
ncbi:MAG: GGDEF domain-containing protein [Polyangiaceae bacterium]